MPEWPSHPIEVTCHLTTEMSLHPFTCETEFQSVLIIPIRLNI